MASGRPTRTPRSRPATDRPAHVPQGPLTQDPGDRAAAAGQLPFTLRRPARRGPAGRLGRPGDLEQRDRLRRVFDRAVGAFEVCRNGLVLTSNALRRAHLGARLADEDGVVEWSQATNTKALELITSKATDAVAAFLNPD